MNVLASRAGGGGRKCAALHGLALPGLLLSTCRLHRAGCFSPKSVLKRNIVPSKRNRYSHSAALLWLDITMGDEWQFGSCAEFSPAMLGEQSGFNTYGVHIYLEVGRRVRCLSAWMPTGTNAEGGVAGLCNLGGTGGRWLLENQG